MKLLMGLTFATLMGVLLMSVPYKASAFTTPTSCGTSSDSGAYGFIQIYVPPPGTGTIYGAATLNSWYGSGANAVLVGFLDGSPYPIAQYTFSGTGSWDDGPANYGITSGYIHVYDGNSNTGAGTFNGYIVNSVTTPTCPYELPSR